MQSTLSPAMLLLLLLFSVSVVAQNNHPLSQAFTAALAKGDAASLSSLLDEEVEFAQTGASGTYRKQLVLNKLSEFFGANPPLRFVMKHQGSSADGQLYAIGQLTTQAGKNFKVLLRARPSGSQYRIMKLEVLQSL